MNPIRKYRKWKLNREQQKVNALLEEEGFTDEVLEKQVAINKKRAKHSIVDETKIINDKYVQ